MAEVREEGNSGVTLWTKGENGEGKDCSDFGTQGNVGGEVGSSPERWWREGNAAAEAEPTLLPWSHSVRKRREEENGREGAKGARGGHL